MGLRLARAHPVQCLLYRLPRPDGVLAPDPARQWIPFALGAGVFFLLVSLAWVWMTYNSLVDLRNRVASAWSQVDVQVKRRFD